MKPLELISRHSIALTIVICIGLLATAAAKDEKHEKSAASKLVGWQKKFKSYLSDKKASGSISGTAQLVDRLNKKLCQKRDEKKLEGLAAGDAFAPVLVAKQLRFQLDNKLRLKNADQIYETKNMKLIRMLDDILRPNELDENLEFCGLESVQHLDSLLANVTSVADTKQCNMIEPIYAYYLNRQRNNCLPGYFQLFGDKSEEQRDLIELLRVSLSGVLGGATGGADQTEFTLETLVRRSPLKETVAAQVFDPSNSEALLGGAFEAFKRFYKQGQQDFVYSEPNKLVASEIIVQYQRAPCTRFIRAFEEIFKPLSSSLIGSLQLNLDLAVFRFDGPQTEAGEFFASWFIYETCLAYKLTVESRGDHWLLVDDRSAGLDEKVLRRLQSIFAEMPQVRRDYLRASRETNKSILNELEKVQQEASERQQNAKTN